MHRFSVQHEVACIVVLSIKPCIQEVDIRQQPISLTMKAKLLTFKNSNGRRFPSHNFLKAEDLPSC